MKLALSICGGGLRGIIPCCVLEALEAHTGRGARETFSYLSGTSTGALLAAGVALGVPASQMLKVYTDQSKRIFSPSGWVAQAKRIATGSMYSPKNLQSVLLETFGDGAGLTFNSCSAPLLLCATAMDGHPWFFTQDTPRNAQTTGSVRIVDAAIASACATTYFPAWPIQVAGSIRKFFDGGLSGTANPAYQTGVEMFEYSSFLPQETRLINLGTGYYPSDPSQEPEGILAEISWSTDSLLDSSEDWVDQAVHRQWGPGLMTKLNPPLPREIQMDDLSAIPDLLKVGREFAGRLDWAALLR